MAKPASRRRMVTGKRRPPVPAWAAGLQARQAPPNPTAELQESHKEPSSSQASSAPQAQPPSPLNDPLLRHRLAQVTHIGANAYLLALAAFQRGLKVTFHYEMASHCPRFESLPVSGVRGELMTISDGRKRHAFYRVMGDLTTREASMQAESKPHTNAVLRKAGIVVAEGVVARPGRCNKAEHFLAKHPEARFLLKPVDGSEGRGVLRDLSAGQVLTHLAAAERPMLLEEFVVGTEYRIYVTGDRVVSAVIRRPASVEGDGRLSVAELVERKAAQRRAHPVYHADPLELDTATQAFLAANGQSENDVPAAGERVFLSDVPSMHEGGDIVDGMTSLPAWVAGIAVRAAQTLDLPHAGLDMILEEEHTTVIRDDTSMPRAVVLEANQNPYIRLTAIAMAGILEATSNAVAESVIDHYFPGSITSLRHPRASFDFNTVCQALNGGTLSEVALPVLGQGWVHKRYIVPAERVEQTLIDQVHQVRMRYGIHAQLLYTSGGEAILDAVAPQQRLRWLENAIGHALNDA